ncbi:unnamed protein product [Lymnaea stagnalis]|uniref:G-protein coupled receptors family 2 profile 2 domain-containing protein n=1 Tax=Lymnaea stagnalis TaxID=6523 RepID=A0AAV2HNS8_LYMST
MMAEGILLIKVTRFPFRTNKIYKYLLPVIFGMPLLVVVTTLAVDSDGFGTPEYCWIRREKGLIFSFVGPVIGVIVFNLAVVLLVLKTICGMDKVRRTNTIEKIRSALWATAVLCPILGLFYITGLFTFTGRSLTYEYIFVSLNSFQGLFVFLFQVCFQSEIRNGIADSYSRYRSRQIVSP